MSSGVFNSTGQTRHGQARTEQRVCGCCWSPQRACGVSEGFEEVGVQPVLGGDEAGRPGDKGAVFSGRDGPGTQFTLLALSAQMANCHSSCRKGVQGAAPEEQCSACVSA